MSQEERIQALADLHDRMNVCQLCQGAGFEVFPRAIFSGGIGARVMVIGQAPGITEVEAGRPFNAGSGTRLFQWLTEAGVEESWFRETQYMTSVTKCYPGRARPDSTDGSGDRVPSPAEQRLCRPYLEREVTLVDPALVIPVGRLAIQLYYPKDLSLEEIIGTEKLVEGRWIVPLPHPSGASRWHQTEDNRGRIREAVGLLERRFKEIFPDAA